MTTIKPWRHLSTRELARTPILTLRAHRRASTETGREAEFYVFEAVDWVNVVAVTENREIVLVEQYRHGVERVSLEIPGGMIDAEDPSPEAAARRELLEETGFAADRWTHIGTVDPNPAIQANRCFTFLAEGARRVADPAPDGLEEIRVVLKRVDAVPQLLTSGRVEHALVVAALYWFELARPR
jgi:8-oxo-dGTP pyrophosphatase MutT (NUDIX family)